jgi:mono/diheme cytochrome c family protein
MRLEKACGHWCGDCIPPSGGFPMSTWKMALPVLAIITSVVALSQQNGSKNDLSGAESYRVYCASCHGVDGKGGGPAAPALKKAPADLTQISKRNHGDFPAFRVTHIIDGYEIEAVHGSREMPVWGDYFRDKLLLELREHNLTEYLRSIQK